jgi:hypothetical protein
MVETISAVTLRVANMRASVRFYKDVLGLEIIHGSESSYFTSLRTKDGDTILNLEHGNASRELGQPGPWLLWWYCAIVSKTNPATLIAVGITPGTFNYRLTAAALGTCAMSEETFGALQFSSHFFADLRRSSFKVSPAAVQPVLAIRMQLRL